MELMEVRLLLLTTAVMREKFRRYCATSQLRNIVQSNLAIFDITPSETNSSLIVADKAASSHAMYLTTSFLQLIA
ncbi:hypothetical protein PV326_005181 [Microctonus aethiopoides]|nr:hypothetical protein PV326_005181 [Microctonus aethiopoides]